MSENKKLNLAAVATDNHAAPSSLAIKPRLKQKDADEKDSMRKRPITNDALREGQGTESSVTVATYQAVAPSGIVLRLPNSARNNGSIVRNDSIQPIEAGQSGRQTGSQSDGGKDDGESRADGRIRFLKWKATTEHKLQGYGTRKSFWPVPADEVESIMLLLAKPTGI